MFPFPKEKEKFWRQILQYNFLFEAAQTPSQDQKEIAEEFYPETSDPEPPTATDPLMASLGLTPPKEPEVDEFGVPIFQTDQ